MSQVKTRRRSRSPVLLPKPTRRHRTPFIPAVADYLICTLIAPLVPRERKALHQIIDAADLLQVGDAKWLLIEADEQLIGILAEVGAERDDFEPIQEDEPQPDDEPSVDDEPSLGARQDTDQTKWSAASGGNHEDLEDECDGREPDDDDRCCAGDDRIAGEDTGQPGDDTDHEPSLAALNELKNQEGWAWGHLAGGDRMDLEDECDDEGAIETDLGASEDEGSVNGTHPMGDGLAGDQTDAEPTYNHRGARHGARVRYQGVDQRPEAVFPHLKETVGDLDRTGSIVDAP